jgi:hypothetical protein
MKTNILIVVLVAVTQPAGAGPMDSVLRHYEAVSGAALNPEAGAARWEAARVMPDGEVRRCSSCHGADPGRPGQHVRTRRSIAPMAPSVNPERLTDIQELEKWFRRNCRWTLGRLCTEQEKGDFVSYLSRQ